MRNTNPWGALGLALAIQGHAKEQNLTEAFDAIVSAYYEEYTDATELDGKTYSALEHLWEICFPAGENANEQEFEEVVKKK